MLITITLSLFFMHCVIEPNGWLLMRIGPFFQKIFKSRIKIMTVILWWSVQHSSNRTRYLNTYMYFYDIDELGTWKWFLRWTEYALQRKGMFHWCSICYGMSLKVWKINYVRRQKQKITKYCSYFEGCCRRLALL